MSPSALWARKVRRDRPDLRVQPDQRVPEAMQELRDRSDLRVYQVCRDPGGRGGRRELRDSVVIQGR
jgi:hypothetical protein